MSDVIQDAHAALLKGDCARIDALIAEGMDVNTRSDTDRWNLLHMALVSVTAPPNPQVIKHLIRLGVDVNAQDRRHWTPLHFAVRTKNAEIVRLLIEAGAEVDAVNDEHISPLKLSVIKAQRNLEVTKILLAANADPDLDGGAGTVRHYLSVASSPDITAFRQLLDEYPKKRSER
ncbi:MAG TPA: ankyrin repeat domain-containing protein [Pirellulaceae bacterium]|jgi:ankyrin repeat protein